MAGHPGQTAHSGCRHFRAAWGDHELCADHQGFDFSGQGFLDDSTGRWRDLFPLPSCELPSVRQGVSASSRKRSIRVRQRAEQANSVVDCLNEMYCANVTGDSLPFQTQAQHDSHHQIFKQLGRFKNPTTKCTVREAVEELLHASSTYDGEESSNTVRAYDRDLVSLPGCGDQPISLAEVMDEQGRELVKDPLSYMMRDDDEWGEMIEHGETFQPYMDTRLQADPTMYAGFIKDLVGKGMLDFTRRPADLVTPFFVVKKNGKLRFILDCRGVNRRFRDPPPLALAAGSTWSQLEVPEDSQLFVAQSDIRDYFFSLELPGDLRPFFCLPPISAEHLKAWGIAQPLDGVAETEGWVWPRCRVVPMGWSWAMYIAQRVHQNICLEASGLTTSRLLVEGRPAPDISNGEAVLIPYADNLNVAGIDEGRVQSIKDTIVARLRGHGFRVHEETEAGALAQSLGFLIDGSNHCITPIPDRWHKVLQAFSWLASRPRVNGKAVERLLGHAVHFAMLRRELLSVFRALYDFVHKSYHRRQRLWKSAAKEARWAQHLFKLCSVNMKRTWSSNTTTSDASLSGVAVCSRELATDVVQRHGRVRETWRYNSGSPVKPRNVVVEAGGPFRDPNTVKPLRPTRSDPYELNFDFPEVEEGIMKKEEWVNSFAIHMQHSEHITLLEGRGVVAALRHKFRASKFFGQKHLHFTDNMSVVLLCSKGRSGNFGMLRVCRRLACLLLATDSFLQVRWVPSERNVADTASRQWESLRINALSTDSASTQKTSRSPISASGRLAAVPRQDPKEGAKAEGQAESRSLESREVGTATSGQSSKKGPEEIPEPILSGESGRLSAGGGRLPQKNAKLLPVSQGEQADTEDTAEQHEEIRRGLLQLHESHVRSRLRTARRNKIPSSRLRHVPRLWPQTCPSTDQEISARVDESGAPKDPSAFAVVTGGCAGDIHVEQQVPGSSRSGASMLHSLPSPRRGSTFAMPRPSSTYATETALVSAPASLRAPREIQSGLGRRKHSAQFQPSPMVGASGAAVEDKQQLPHRHHLLRAGAKLAASTERDRPSQRPCSSIPTSAQRAVTRQISQSPSLGRGETTGPMDGRLDHETIRSTCPTEPRVSRPTQGNPKAVSSSRSHSCEPGPQIFRPQKPEDGKGTRYVIEIFSGCARLSKACAAAGFISMAYDIEYGSQCDLLDATVLKNILEFLRKHSKQIALVWLGTPCTTWSRARKNDGGPKPLRDDCAGLFGLPNNAPKDKAKIIEGNRLLQASENIISLCQYLMIPWAMENPYSSRIWLTPKLRMWQLQRAFVRIDFCAFQMPWRKSTGILFGSGADFNSLACACETRQGRCGFTGRKHIILVGKDLSGQWMTRRAQPYPWLLCHKIAALLQ